VKLLDFGIARVPSLAQHRTQSGCLKGKPSYATPEQLKQRPFDGRSDVFSLGITLWEMLTMRRLFAGDTDFETVTNVMKRPIPPPSAIRGEVPANLDDIVMRSLARDPDKRPGAREVADRLGEYLRSVYYLEDALVDLMQDLREDARKNAGAPVSAVKHTALAAAKEPTSTDVIGSHEFAALQLGAGASELPPADAVAPRPRRTRTVSSKVRAAIVALAISSPGLSAAIDWGSGGRLRAAIWAARTPVATSDVVVELDSRPSGATVEQAGAALGITPLVIKMPRSLDKAHLVIKKPGFEPLAYDATREHDSIATLDLAPVPPPYLVSTSQEPPLEE
jgi:serine/threonine-protein kinase